jgi:hypothetical protein
MPRPWRGRCGCRDGVRPTDRRSGLTGGVVTHYEPGGIVFGYLRIPTWRRPNSVARRRIWTYLGRRRVMTKDNPGRSVSAVNQEIGVLAEYDPRFSSCTAFNPCGANPNAPLVQDTAVTRLGQRTGNFYGISFDRRSIRGASPSKNRGAAYALSVGRLPTVNRPPQCSSCSSQAR